MFEEKGLFANVAYADGRVRGAMGIDWGEYMPGKYGAVIANFANEPITFLTVADAAKLRFTDSGAGGRTLRPEPLLAEVRHLLLRLRPRRPARPARLQRPPRTRDHGRADGPAVRPAATTLLEHRRPAAAVRAGNGGSSGPDLFKPLVGRGCAYLDFDGDGDLDVVLVENNGHARLLRNDTNLGNKFVRLTLIGDGKTANASAIGAQVTVEAGGKTYRRDVAGARGYLSQSELPITVGLGSTETIDKVTVRWPGKDAGAPQVWTNLKANTAYTLRQGQAEAEPTKK